MDEKAEPHYIGRISTDEWHCSTIFSSEAVWGYAPLEKTLYISKQRPASHSELYCQKRKKV